MDTQAEALLTKLLVRAYDIIAALQAENSQVKELLNKDKKPEKVNARKS